MKLFQMSQLRKMASSNHAGKTGNQKNATSPETWFGLEYSEVKHETVPLIIGNTRKTWLKERL